MQKLQDMSRDPNESETDYFARFMRQHNFCGNYLEPAALRSTFINSLQPRLRHAVHRFISTKREADMAYILQFVQDEGKAQRHWKEFLEKSSRTPAVDKDRSRRGGDSSRPSRRVCPGSLQMIEEPSGVSEPIETLMIANHDHVATPQSSSVLCPDRDTSLAKFYHTAQ